MIARGNFLKANLVKTDRLEIDPNDENSQTLSQKPNDQKTNNKNAKSVDEVKSSKVIKKNNKTDSMTKSSQDLSMQPQEQMFNNDSEEILLNRPPTPPKAKIFLPPIDASPFIRSKQTYPILKDAQFIKDQDVHRKTEVNNFIQFKEHMHKFRDEEKKYRLYQKFKQIEECENLQVNQLSNLIF